MLKHGQTTRSLQREAKAKELGTSFEHLFESIAEDITEYRRLKRALIEHYTGKHSLEIIEPGVLYPYWTVN